MKRYNDDCVISIIDILKIYFSIAEYFLKTGEDRINVGFIGPRDKKILSNAVASQMFRYTKNNDLSDDYLRCAALFYELIKSNPFYNCNKTTALISVLYYLAKISRVPTTSHKELEIITRIIASNTLRNRKAFQQYAKFENGEVRFLAIYLQETTLPLDKKDFLLTYMELNKILSDLGFCLKNPHGNSIDIYRIETRSSIFGVLKNKKKYTRVGVISFSDWEKKVKKNKIRNLIEYTGLTAREGFDSHIGYIGTPPISSMINKYSKIIIILGKND